MRLVFVTQVMDRGDAVLGFVPRWIEGLARAVERVRVVALEVGDVANLPANVDLREIGRRGVVRRYLRYRSILDEALGRDRFDAVLAHMVPRYLNVAKSIAQKRGARTYLWYTHGAVDERLRKAVASADKVFTATRESLRIESPKVIVTGHGIDLAHFDARGEAPANPPRVLSVGRLTPSKDPLTVIAALARLAAQGRAIELDLVGGTLASGDPKYLREVEARIRELGVASRVHLRGPIAYRDVPAFFRRASVVVNASSTGSLDKVVLEAMACGRAIVSCNDAFPRLVAELGESARDLIFERGDEAALAARIDSALLLPPDARARLGTRLRSIVERDHEVDRLMARLAREMESA